MNLKLFAVVAAVVLVVTAFTMSNLVQPVAAKSEKCFIEQSKDRDSTLRFCDILTKDQINGLKKECKETTDNKEVRCSSSQTGNGELGPPNK